MDFKDFLNEGEVKIAGSSDVVNKLKVLKLAVDDWLKAAETSHEGNSAFIITKAIKNVNSHVKKTAESIVNAVNMEKKYKGK